MSSRNRKKRSRRTLPRRNQSKRSRKTTNVGIDLKFESPYEAPVDVQFIPAGEGELRIFLLYRDGKGEPTNLDQMPNGGDPNAPHVDLYIGTLTKRIHRIDIRPNGDVGLNAVKVRVMHRISELEANKTFREAHGNFEKVKKAVKSHEKELEEALACV